MRWTRSAGALVLAVVMMAGTPASAGTQNDAGTGSDAGDRFDRATRIAPSGAFAGRLDRDGGDEHDFYRFRLREGEAFSVLVEMSTSTVDPVELLAPDGTILDAGTQHLGLGLTLSSAFTGEGFAVRLAVHRAPVTGDYRLHLKAVEHDLRRYSLCLRNCDEPRWGPMEFAFGGSLQGTRTKVLLVPPTHGDLGDLAGPTVIDYIDATLRGIRRWPEVINRFVNDNPRFAYLREITIEVDVFDQASPVDPVGYDAVVGYVAAGPAFRGLAASTIGLSFGDDVRWSGRLVALSLLGSSPRAGQVHYDFPEVDDLESVTIHEFGHVFGLGHTTTWHPRLGPDLMNSPAPFVYGNGSAVGDGGERSGLGCLSSLNLYGLAVAYRWIPTGEWERTIAPVDLPSDVPYRRYC